MAAIRYVAPGWEDLCCVCAVSSSSIKIPPHLVAAVGYSRQLKTCEDYPSEKKKSQEDQLPATNCFGFFLCFDFYRYLPCVCFTVCFFVPFSRWGLQFFFSSADDTGRAWQARTPESSINHRGTPRK